MAEIISDTPGRLRLRLRPDRRHKQHVDRVTGHLAAADGITAVNASVSTGSLTVHYDPRRRTSADLIGLLHDIGVVVQKVSEPGEETSGRSVAADGIVEAVNDLDRRLARLTGHKIDLKLLFPLGLGGLGAYQLLRNGFELGELPPYVLLWYAFDAFFKLHVRVPDAARDTAPEQPAEQTLSHA